MEYLACQTEVVQVIRLVLDTLEDPHILSRVVDVVDWGRATRADLPVRAYATLIPHLLLAGGE